MPKCVIACQNPATGLPSPSTYTWSACNGTNASSGQCNSSNPTPSGWSWSWVDSDGNSCNTQQCTVSYSSTGTKNATVTVYDNGTLQSGSQTCTTQISIPTPPQPTATDNISNSNQCLFEPDTSTSKDIKIQWTNNSVPVSWVDISDNDGGAFTQFYHEQVTGLAGQAYTIYAPVGFTGFNGSIVGQQLILQPGHTYYIRLYNGTWGATSSVYIPQCPPVAVSCQNPEPSGTTGQSYTWFASASGGDGQYVSWNWQWNDPSTGPVVSNTHNSYTNSSGYSPANTYQVKVTVTDTDTQGQSHAASATCSANVYAPLAVSCQPNTPSCVEDQPCYWSAYPTGGSGNYSVTKWTDSPDGNRCPPQTGSICNGLLWTITYTTPGTRNATVKIKDNVTGNTASSSNPECKVTVNAPSNLTVNGDTHSNN